MTPVAPVGWRLERRERPAAELCGGWPTVEASPERRAVALCRPLGPALALGSTQRDGVADAERCRARGTDVVRRRSGGGAVLVTPDDPVWVDVWVPADDPLWESDVTTAFEWVGRWWGRALAEVGIDTADTADDGARTCTRWSSLVCFGGVGAGELTTTDGRKVVGVAQRRTRAGAWFHTAAYRRWRPEQLVELLALSPEDRELATSELAQAATGLDDVGGDGTAAALPATLAAALP